MLHGADRGIESLDVADLNDRGIFVRRLDDFSRFENVLRERFLDQTGDAALEERLGQVVMKLRRHCHGSGGDLRQQIAQVLECAAAEFLGYFVGGLVMSVVNPDQTDVRHLRIDAGVKPSHPPAADDGHRYELVGSGLCC